MLLGGPWGAFGVLLTDSACSDRVATLLSAGSSESARAAFIRAGVQYLASACCSAAGPAPLSVRATSGVRRTVLLTTAVLVVVAFVVAPAVPAVARLAAIAGVAARPPRSLRDMWTPGVG